MALLHLDGFDKFGPANSNSTSVAALLTAGEWTTATAPNIVAGLSATGFALSIGTTAGSVIKTLVGNYARLIGGVRFSSNLAGNNIGIQFLDGGANQASISVNITTGTISVRNGSYLSGTVVATSTASVTASSTHYLEWDITFGNAAAYQVWLDGVSILSGTGDTTATANNFANGFGVAAGTGAIGVFDDLYLFDATGTTNNAVLLTSPRIETQFPSADAAVQFAVGAATLGPAANRTGSFVSTAANQFRVKAVTPTRACTINSISFRYSVASATINLRPVIYSDNAGAPGTLLSAGSTVTGMTPAPGYVTMPLTTPQALTAGTQYWIGFMCDIAVTNTLGDVDGLNNDRTGTSTFASGAPGTAPATSLTRSAVLFGNISGTGANYYEVSQNPPQDALSYVYDATVGHEDLYNFPALSAPPSAIYAVAVKGSLSKSDAGAKTASLRLKSSATDSAGSTASIAPGTSYAWASSNFPLDPNGNVAWTLSALNAAQAGVKVET